MPFFLTICDRVRYAQFELGQYVGDFILVCCVLDIYFFYCVPQVAENHLCSNQNQAQIKWLHSMVHLQRHHEHVINIEVVCRIGMLWTCKQQHQQPLRRNIITSVLVNSYINTPELWFLLIKCAFIDLLLRCHFLFTSYIHPNSIFVENSVNQPFRSHAENSMKRFHRKEIFLHYLLHSICPVYVCCHFVMKISFVTLRRKKNCSERRKKKLNVMAYALNASCLSSWFVSFRCIRISFLRNYFYREFFFCCCHISKEKYISRFRIKWILSFVGHHTYQHNILFGISRTNSGPITLSHSYLFVIVLHSECASVMQLPF